MNISILIPSRNRPAQLRELLVSIFSTAVHLMEIEVLASIDKDDPQLAEYQKIPKEIGPYNFRLIIGDRKECFPDYYNDLARMAYGRILWTLNDDCLVTTEGWDITAVDKAKDFADFEGHSIWYGDVWDSTRNYEGTRGEYSCFPMLSRESFEALGYFFCPDNKTHGTDKFLKHVFEKSGAGIIKYSDIMVMHKHILNDQTSLDLYEKFGRCIGQECTIDYQPSIDRLKEAIAL